VPSARSSHLPSVLAPFRVASFRFQWPSDLLTSWAFEMETLILGWYVLVETKSVLLLTVFGALQFVGTLLSPMIGMLGDRLGHRNVYCMMRATYMTLAAILTAIAFAGLVTPLVVLVIAALCGLVRPSDLAVRQTLVAETMPADRLLGAMGIARTTSDLARIGGALAGAGLFAALGMAQAYVCVTVCYGLSLLLTFGIQTESDRIRRLKPQVSTNAHPVAKPASPLRQTGEGLVYVWRQPHMLAGMWIAFLVNLTAFPLSGGLLPYVAREVYQMNQTGLGMLVASFASGALVGSVTLTFIGRSIQPARCMIIFAAIWYAMLLVFAQMRIAPAGSACLVVAGFAQSMSMVPLATMLLRTAAPEFRGRVMGVRMLAIYSLPIGLLVAGTLIERIGFHVTATLYATIGLLFTALIALKWRTAVWNVQSIGNAR
jgi:predicted MFS family arabinose efflux permease